MQITASNQPAGPTLPVAPKVFANLDALDNAMKSGAVKVGDDISISGRIWDTHGPGMGEIRLTDDLTYLTIRLNARQGIVDALEAVSKDRTGMPVTVNGTLRGLGWGPSDRGIDVASVQIPGIHKPLVG